MKTINSKNEFAEILEEILIERGLKQAAFAELVGVKQSQVSEWLKAKAKPGYDTLKKMSVALDIDPKFLLGLSEMPKNN